MRVTCPSCKDRFDVSHSAVLHEAERLRDGRYARTPAGGPDAPEVDGNQATRHDRPSIAAEWRKAYGALVIDNAKMVKLAMALKAENTELLKNLDEARRVVREAADSM